MKEIKREFSVARTPQQNRVVEIKNRTLIEATKTMLADSLLTILFWADAVNTVCHVENRVLVTKPHNKTPYELLLGKFDRKDDEGFLVGYSVISKAFRVFSSRIRIVQETLHINFLENQPNVAGSEPKWLFDIDTLTQSMNYQPVVAENQPNPSACIQDDAGKVRKKTNSTQQYVLLPFWSTGSKDPQNTDADAAFDVKENENEVHVSPSIIKFGDSYMVPANTDPADSRTGRTITATTEDMQKKKNDVKAMTTLLLSLPDEHQLRLQVIVSQLQFMDVDIEKDDLNQKFLTSLALEWLIDTIL
nr:hypothetical protein [Tanacetum cinerariifolium]